jgi:hypothetical protein
MSDKEILWLDFPEAHDYPAARSFLALSLEKEQLDRVLDKLESAPIEKYKAKDILRASKLKALGLDNKHVARDLKKINDEQALSPVLLIRGNLNTGEPLVIADGYHRTCAVYRYNEDAYMSCQIVSL